MRKLDDDDLARGPEEVFTIISKIGRGWGCVLSCVLSCHLHDWHITIYSQSVLCM